MVPRRRLRIRAKLAGPSCLADEASSAGDSYGCPPREALARALWTHALLHPPESLLDPSAGPTDGMIGIRRLELNSSAPIRYRDGGIVRSSLRDNTCVSWSMPLGRMSDALCSVGKESVSS